MPYAGGLTVSLRSFAFSEVDLIDGVRLRSALDSHVCPKDGELRKLIRVMSSGERALLLPNQRPEVG